MADSLNEPRYPSLKGIMGAKKKPQDTKGLADIGVDARRPARPARAPRSSGLGEPPSRGDTIKIEDEGDAAQKILDFLVERKLV